MENVTLVFKGTEKSKTEDHTLVAYANTNNEIYLCIDMKEFPPGFICLSKQTAVRLVRELKKHIGYLQND